MHSYIELFKRLGGVAFINTVNVGGAHSYLQNIVKNKQVPILIIDGVNLKTDVKYKVLVDQVEHGFSAKDLNAIISKFSINHLYVNHLIGTQSITESIDCIVQLSDEVSLSVVVHDFFMVCPTVNLLNYNGEYCDIPSYQECLKCIRRYPYAAFSPKFSKSQISLYESELNGDIRTWRSIWAKLFKRTNLIIVPSNSVADIFNRAYDHQFMHKISVEYHSLPELKEINIRKKSISQDGFMHIYVLGHIVEHKGARILKDLIHRTMLSKLNICYHVVGEFDCPEYINSPFLEVSGLYQQEQLIDILNSAEIDLFIQPTICPETFSYVLHEMMATRLPIMAFNLGAQGEFLANYENAILINEVTYEEMFSGIYAYYNKYLESFYNMLGLESRSKELIKLVEELQKRDREIKELVIHIKGLDVNATSLGKQIIDKERHIQNQNAQIADQGKQIVNKDEQIVRNQHLNQQVINLNDMLSSIINSRSWKLTKILRGLGLMARKVRRILHKVPKVIFRCFIGKKYYVSQKKKLKHQRVTTFKYMPLISIIVPTFNTPERFLIEMFKSVINQSYLNWELCIVDGASSNLATLRILNKYLRRDKRIKVSFLAKNHNISGNTNNGLKLVTGDYVAFLDHDDLLTPDCLYEYVKAINQYDKPTLLYCDEDKTNETTSRFFDPFFKPDFAIDTLRTSNYICHFCMIRSDVLRKVGELDSNCNGAQDYDLILRTIDISDNVIHIPRVLYHWRVHANSTAANSEAKSYTVEAGVVAIRKHLFRRGLKADVQNGVVPNVFKVNYVISGTPLVSIVIPNKDHREDLEKCINSIFAKSTYKNFEIVVVENNSSSNQLVEYYDYLMRSHKNIKVVKWVGDFNFSKICNFGVTNTTGKFIVLLNNDTEVITPNWIEEMLMFSQRSDVGAVGAKLYYPDNTIQHAGVCIGAQSVAGHINRGLDRSSGGYFGMANWIQNVSCVTAACIMIRRDIFELVGGLDEQFKVAFNDVDLCMRIRKAGYLIVFNPYCELYHFESKSRGFEDTPEKKNRFNSEIALFETRWGLWLDDPYYNVNFSKHDANYTIRLN